MIVVAGESLIDLVAGAAQSPLQFTAHAGGSPYNCARALALLDEATGYLCPLSQDSFGDMLRAPLEAAGVTPLLDARSTKPTTLAVVTRNAAGLPRYDFYRQGTAERDLDAAALRAALPERLDAFQMGGFLPIEAEDAEIWLTVVQEAKARGAMLSIDPNVRPGLVPDFKAYAARLDRFFDLAHLIKVSDEDLEVLAPGRAIESHALALLERPHCELVVVTRGEKGSLAYTRHARAQAPIHPPARFGDTVGAGDSLMAGLLAALSGTNALSPQGMAGLDARALEEILRFGAAVAGLNCQDVGCHPPTRAMVDAALGSA